MNVELLYHVYKHTLPAAFSLLPGRMDTPEAKAMLLAIGLQESDGFNARVQYGGGPAHGFWQFEKGGGVRGVLSSPTTAPLILPVLQTLRYRPNEAECYAAIVHNDVLAACFARLLLWNVPGRLAGPSEPQRGWDNYIAGWRPGKPHRATWDRFFAEGWRTVTEE